MSDAQGITVKISESIVGPPLALWSVDNQKLVPILNTLRTEQMDGYKQKQFPDQV